MRTAIPRLLLPALLVASCSVQRPAIPPNGTGVIAIVEVDVVPMDAERVLERQMVIVRDGRIVALGRDVAVPDEAVRIDGRGRYLMPGLADLHVHIFDRDEFILYLASGVTTVLNLHGTPTHLRWRDSLASNLLLGPRLYTSGPIIDGDPPTRPTNHVVRSAAEAATVVAHQQGEGYDFIKIYDHLPRDLYEAVLEAARERNLRVIGHIPTHPDAPVGLEGLLEVGDQYAVEHVEELLPFFSDGADTSGVAGVAQALAAAGIWVVPTLSVYASAAEQVAQGPALFERPAMRFVNPETVERWGWHGAAQQRFGNPNGQARFTRTNRFFEEVLLPALHRAGVRLVVGTDAPIPTLIPGSSIMMELRAFVRAGLSPYETLVAATRDAAAFVGHPDMFGTVEVGKAADLLLLRSNPLDDIEAVAYPEGVMVRGHWLPRDTLQARLDALAATYTPVR